MPKKITAQLVSRLKPREKSDYTVYDTELNGYGVRVYPSGVRTYIVRYRKNNHTYRVVLGRSTAARPRIPAFELCVCTISGRISRRS